MDSEDSAVLPGAEGTAHDSSTSESVDAYSRFLIYLKNSIEEMLSGVSEEDFATYLGKLSVIKNSRSVPRKMQKKMKASLKEAVWSEILETIKEVNLKEKLQKLEKLADESLLDEGCQQWRPNRNIKDHIRSHVMEVKLKYEDQLEKLVREKEQDCECVKSKVIKLRAQVRTLESRLQVLKNHSKDTSVSDHIDNMMRRADKVEDLVNYYYE